MTDGKRRPGGPSRVCAWVVRVNTTLANATCSRTEQATWLASIGPSTRSLRCKHWQPFKLAWHRSGGFSEAEMTLVDAIDNFKTSGVRDDVATTQGFVVHDADGGQPDHVLAVACAPRHEFFAVAKGIGQRRICPSIP
jgi:hypothetical protein